MAFGSGRGTLALDDGATPESVAAECRDAALSFVNGVAAGWDKLDLVLWLTGSYARATGHVPRGERVTGLTADGEVAPAALEQLMTRVRSQVLASLEKAVLSGGTLELAVEAMDRGLVLRGVDPDGEIVWLPVDLPRLRLRDRVRALFAADYLNDPAAYVELYVCHRCENVVFDRNAKVLGACANHKRSSGIVPRRIEDDDLVEVAVAASDD